MKHERKRDQGFTLIEIIFVLAIIITLTAIFAPLAMDKLSQSSTTAAQADIDAIAASVTNFFSDLGNFPSCDSTTDCDPLSDAVNNLAFAAVCTGVGSCVSEYPGDSGALWSLAANDEATPEINNFFNHVAVNDPNQDGTENGAGTDYRTTKWKGPYIAKLGPDPYGNAYIIHVGAMQKNGSPISSGRGWILSAGPDGNLDTPPAASVISGDDIGYIFCTNC
jgi:prepilin-type N-terminal cleavage/methylation domain-containing protein